MMDEKKRKRMVSNRESARRSRMKKQNLVQNLTEEASKLQIANNGIAVKIDAITNAYMMYTVENSVLSAQEMELTERLRSLNDVLRNSGVAVDIPELPDPLLRPWQFPSPVQPMITASSGLFW